ncbi:MAG TPA: cytidine deaminase [Chitinophagales bacterium]|nr:cytidine deaminase [Chitinophagales bacterium]HNM31793.1 cytidine deaminase [Chitinophagales bacterium]
MKSQLKFEINYTGYDTFEDAPEVYQQLIAAAREAKKGAYAPYSNFNVGAALLLNNGKIIQGSNQENAAYPIGFCAERTALSAAASLASHEKIKAIAITCSSVQNPVLKPAAPCGICRQTIFEAECKHQQDIEVILMGESGPVYVFKSIKDLLPLHFDADFL